MNKTARVMQQPMPDYKHKQQITGICSRVNLSFAISRPSTGSICLPPTLAHC